MCIVTTFFNITYLITFKSLNQILLRARALREDTHLHCIFGCGGRGALTLYSKCGTLLTLVRGGCKPVVGA